jgi:hypothetical protein
MKGTYQYKPGFRFKFKEQVYSFGADGLFTTDDRQIQAALEKCRPFISGEMKRQAEPLRYAVKIYSPILGGYLWVVQDKEAQPNIISEEVPVYEADEIEELGRLKGLTHEELRLVHEAKKVFKGSTITKEG